MKGTEYTGVGVIEMDMSCGVKPLVSLSLDELLNYEFPVREPILNPVFLLGSLNMIFAKRGVGKTHASLGIAYAAASGGDFFGWQASRPFKTLFIDGEMPGSALQERLANIVSGSQKEPPENYFKILTIDANDGQMPDLSTFDGQQRIERLCDESELVVVDNLSCLARTGKENDAESWVILSEWALKLRSQGKCVIFIHHAGKGGQQRGTSKREDLLDVILELKHPANYEPDEGARFMVNISKGRHLMGDDAKSFEAKLCTNEHGVPTWATTPAVESTYEQVCELANLGLTQTEIANELEINKSNICRAYKRGVDEGIIMKRQPNRKRKNTEYSRSDLNG
jgi:AAA domain-containing protein